MNTELNYIIESTKNMKSVDQVLSWMDGYTKDVWSLITEEWGQMSDEQKTEFATKLIGEK